LNANNTAQFNCTPPTTPYDFFQSARQQPNHASLTDDFDKVLSTMRTEITTVNKQVESQNAIIERQKRLFEKMFEQQKDQINRFEKMFELVIKLFSILLLYSL
jgi:hypothetical protein